MTDDHAAIERLIYAYSDLIDAADFVGLGELFGRGTYRVARPDGSTSVLTGAEQVTRNFVDGMLLVDGSPRTLHCAMNVVIDVSDDRSTAAARCYQLVVHSVPGETMRLVSGGRMRDEFARTDGVWHFTDRHLTLDMFGDTTGMMRPRPAG